MQSPPSCNVKTVEYSDTYSSRCEDWRMRCRRGVRRCSVRWCRVGGRGVRGRGRGRGWRGARRLVPTGATLGAWSRCLLNGVHAGATIRTRSFGPSTVVARSFCLSKNKTK